MELINLANLSTKQRKVLSLLALDVHVTDVTVLNQTDNGATVGFSIHTAMPTRDYEESYYDYDARTEDWTNREDCGLSEALLYQLRALGLEVRQTDCPGLENEGVIYVD